MEKLFSYGTLRFKSVQRETFGRLLSGESDVLVGYALGEVEITDPDVIEKSGTNIHPILRYTGNTQDYVDGIVFEVTLDELHNADEYEVEEYTRIEAEFRSGKKAWIYAATDEVKAI